MHKTRKTKKAPRTQSINTGFTHKPMLFATKESVGFTSLIGLRKRLNDFPMPILKFQIDSCAKYVHSFINEFYLETDDAVYYVSSETGLDADWVKSKYEKYRNQWNTFKQSNPDGSFQHFSYYDDNVQYVNMTHNNCYQSANLVTANAYLTEFNRELQHRGIEIEINELQNMRAVDLWIYEEQSPDEMLEKNYLLLCLNIGNRCISSIVLAPMIENKQEIEIISATRHELQGLGYNTLLRALAIILVKKVWRDATSVVSRAVNIVSAWILVSKFGGETADTPLNTMDEIDNYIFNNGMVTIKVKLDAQHIGYADNIVTRWMQ